MLLLTLPVVSCVTLWTLWHVSGGVLISTIFFPKMHTISQQSKYRKLKMHSPGSDSTVYTTYTTDYPRYYRVSQKKLSVRENGCNYNIFWTFCLSKESFEKFRIWGFQNCPYFPKLIRNYWRYYLSKLPTLKFCNCPYNKSINKIFNFFNLNGSNISSNNPTRSTMLFGMEINA